ncbi:hypothetical protein D3C87_2211610 [compost metagenome]
MTVLFRPVAVFQTVDQERLHGGLHQPVQKAEDLLDLPLRFHRILGDGQKASIARLSGKAPA